MKKREEYIKGSDYDLKAVRHNKIVFAREMRNKPMWGVGLMACFATAGVFAIAWRMDWVGMASFAAAFYVGWTSFGKPLFFGDRAEREEEAVLREADEEEAVVQDQDSAFVMLDIDGVLHPFQSGTLVLLPVFEEWLRQWPSVKVVISSDWRYTHPEEELRTMFADDLRDRMHGFTPVLEGAPREDEVLEYVKANGIKKWVAFDDVKQGFPSTGSSNLVHTTSKTGLTGADLEKAAEMLGLETQTVAG